jgi:hypothetical protein
MFEYDLTPGSSCSLIWFACSALSLLALALAYFALEKESGEAVWHELIVQILCTLIYFVGAVGSVAIVYSTGITFGRLFFLGRIFAENASSGDQKIKFLTRLRLFAIGAFIAGSLGTIGSLSWSVAIICLNRGSESPGPVLGYLSSGTLVVHLVAIILLLYGHYAAAYDLSPCVAEG